MGEVSANEQLKQILRAGKLFEGKYRIQRPLGAGSFAVVVQAMHEVMGREVALKFLKPKVVEGNAEVADRFIKEVQIASKLKHPNVVTIFDFGKTEDGIYYMVQEFIDGVTLDEVLLEAPGRRLPRERVLDQVRQVLSCLDQAHKLGIIHRDLKPSNLMSMQREGREVIKVLDFGVAKLLEQDGPSSGGSRQSTKFIGTPIYMSPEQILGLEVHGASDLYSIGLMLYELLTGDAPIHAQQVAEVVQQHLSPQAFAFPLLPTLEPAIQRTILKATARYPEDRFRTARDFLAALDGELVEDEASSTAERPAAAYVVADDKTEEEDLEAFLGRNYIAIDAQLPQESAFEPVRPSPRPMPELRPQGAPPPAARRRDSAAPSAVLAGAQPQAAPLPAPRSLARPEAPSEQRPRAIDPGASSTSALTQLPPEALELDRSALREVKRRGAPGGRKAAAVHPSARQAMERVTQEQPRGALHASRWPLYGAALLALYLCAVMLTSLTDGLPAAARVLIGLLPGAMAVGLSAGTHAHRAGGVGSRWLVPSSLYCLAMLAGTVVLTLLVFPGRAEIALKHEGVWLLSALPDVAPLTSLKAATASLMHTLASACAQIGPALPWG